MAGKKPLIKPAEVGRRRSFYNLEGSNCPSCGEPHFPPRQICPDCGFDQERNEFFPISPEGRLGKELKPSSNKERLG